MRRFLPRSWRAAAAVLSAMAVLGTTAGTAGVAGAATSSTAGSSPGITSNSVTVGNVSILSGPVPGLFQGAPNGVNAYFAYVNSHGGVNGRKLILNSQDDVFSCGNNTNETRSIIATDFAFVGNYSLFDTCGATLIKQVPSMPDVSPIISPTLSSLPNNFNPIPQQQGFRTGALLWYKQHYPNAIKHVGTLVGNVTSAVDSWLNEEAAMKHLGYKIAYSRLYNPLESDFTADIIRMRNDGVQFLSLTATDAQLAAVIMNEAAQQNWHPQVLETAGISYDPVFLKNIQPGAANGLWNDQQTAMFLPGGDQKTTPGVKLFDTWMAKKYPNFKLNLFTVDGWVSAVLFVQALKAAGPNPTRDSVSAQLRKITTFDAGGLIAPDNPAQKKPPTCWLMVRFNGTKFTRYSPADKGFRCDGGYYKNPNPPSK